MRKIVGLFLLMVGVGSLLGFISVPKAISSAGLLHYGFSLIIMGISFVIIFLPTFKRFYYNRQEDYYRLVHYGIGWKENRKRRYSEWRWKSQQRLFTEE